MKSRLLAVLVVMCLARMASATPPWPAQIVTSPSSNYVAWLQSNPNESLVIRSNNTVFCRFLYKDFGIPERSAIDLMSTAGLLWYRDGISFFDKAEKHLVVRLRWGWLVVVDLRTQSVSSGMAPELQQEVNETLRRYVLTCLNSSDPCERETGAWHAGDLKLHDAIPRLRELTTDPTKGDYKNGNAPWVKSYSVRKAAVNALRQMNVVVTDVVLEEPGE